MTDRSVREEIDQYAYIAHMRGMLARSPRVHYEPDAATGDEMRLAQRLPQAAVALARGNVETARGTLQALRPVVRDLEQEVTRLGREADRDPEDQQLPRGGGPAAGRAHALAEAGGEQGPDHGHAQAARRA